MAVQYTQEQKEVIWRRGGNLLVSAAAGSGKTAVLVERIIQRIQEENNPVSVDELLVVTFTNAAAKEMKERIGKSLENLLSIETDKKKQGYLGRQLTLLASAHIMTLHSFCLKIIKSHYHLLDLDPGFRIGNETEIILLKEEIIEDLLEEYHYQQ